MKGVGGDTKLFYAGKRGGYCICVSSLQQRITFPINLCYKKDLAGMLNTVEDKIRLSSAARQ